MSKKMENNLGSPHVCPHNHAWILDNWIRKLLQNPRRIVGEYIKEGDTVVDLGCGPGFFSIQMAKIVGEKGKVISVDLQEEMLTRVKKNATTKKVAHQMAFHRCESNRVELQLDDKADFMLAYYMIHETPDAAAFLTEVKDLLKEGGKFLVVEPKMHVTEEAYWEMIDKAKDAGFSVVGYPQKKGGRSVLLTL